MSTLEKLKKRWKVHSLWQVILILCVFAATGFTFLWVEKQLAHLFGIEKGESFWSKALFFIVVTLPVYNTILLIYGTIVGQFKFFWNFEKRFFGRLIFWKRKPSDQ